MVATKFTPAKWYDPSTRFSAKDLLPTLDGSLQRLRVDTIDLYQLHYQLRDDGCSAFQRQINGCRIELGEAFAKFIARPAQSALRLRRCRAW